MIVGNAVGVVSAEIKDAQNVGFPQTAEAGFATPVRLHQDVRELAGDTDRHRPARKSVGHSRLTRLRSRRTGSGGYGPESG